MSGDRKPWRRLFAGATAAFCVLSAAPAREEPVAETLSGFEEAIRLRERLSEEKSEWQGQKRILEAEIRMLESHLVETRRQIPGLRSERSEARARRETLRKRKENEEAAARELDRLAEEIFPALADLAEILPPWSTAAPPTEDAAPAELLRGLRQAFADDRRIHARIREVEDSSTGETVRVDLLAPGLAGAFFSSPDGSFGGRYVFDGEAWSREEIPDYAARIREAILQAEGRTEPRFLSLPVSIGDGR